MACKKMKYQVLILIVLITMAPGIAFCQPVAKEAPAPVINIVNDSTIVINKRVVLNENDRSISFPAKFPKKNARGGIIELILCNKMGKAYESLLVTDVTPIELQTALLLLGYKSMENKLPIDDKSLKKKEKRISKADSVYLYVQWTDSTNKVLTQRIENFIWDPNTNTNIKPVSWFFNGLLTGEDGKIICHDWISMIVNNYDFESVLSLNYNPVLNTQVGTAHHINSARDNTYYLKVDKSLLGKEVQLIIKPASVKKNHKHKIK